MRILTSLRGLGLVSLITFLTMPSIAQQTYPEAAFNQSYVPPSPNGAASTAYGDQSVALYTGTPSVSIPIYTVKCGSLALPISLSYNYNGLFPLQDAGWVGLGWNLNAGGMITREVEGGVDNSENTGYNYGQFNLADTITGGSPDPDVFWGSAYNNLLGNSGKSYDLAPDIFDAEFNGYSDKFIWVSGKAYMMTWDKDFGVSWPSPTSSITITTADGTIYTFGAGETTTNYYYGGEDSTHQSYTSAWDLTSIVSADHKDTITLSYAVYSWQQAGVSYQTTYTKSNGGQPDMGIDSVGYDSGPSISSAVLQSIQCRNYRIQFVPDTAVRTDISGTYPRLRAIDVIDSLTRDTIKKNTFSYEYFGQTSVSPATRERLALKSFSSVNSTISSDSLTYIFKYINEYGVFPTKATTSIDIWGYCNDTSNGTTILPPNSSGYYYPGGWGTDMGNDNRTPNFTYCSYGALDTIVYPTGGYRAYQYEQNTVNGSAGPGICVQSVTSVSNNPISPQVIQKTYTYSSGNCLTPLINGSPFVLSNSSGTYNYTSFTASNNGTGIGGWPTNMYYSQVTETMTGGGETHKTDHYFTSFPEMFQDVRETERIDYRNDLNTNAFTPLSKTVTTYTQSYDTTYYSATPFIDSEYINTAHNPKSWYAYSYYYFITNWSYWIRPASVQTTQYDVNGDSLVQTTNYGYNTTTRNLAYLTQTTSDNQMIKKKFKYPEDYSSGITGSMVSARVLRPVIEQQTWMYPNSNDSLLIAGTITQYDQTIFKPTTVYTIETTKPIAALSNETISGGLYTSLLSDSRYIMKEQIQYDAYDNVNVTTRSADMPVSYIWDYRHGQVIAKVQNAVQADIAYSSFEADGTGGWSVSGGGLNPQGVTGNSSWSMHLATISKSGLTSTNTYIVSYWTSNGSAYSIAGTVAGYPIQGNRINGWSYFEHKITGVTSVSITGTGNIDELRLYPANAQMVTYTYQPSVGMSTQCDVDNKATYYLYDGFNRLKVVADQDHNIIKTIQYHTIGETVE